MGVNTIKGFENLIISLWNSKGDGLRKLELDWFQQFGKISQEFHKNCGCPMGESFQKRGKLSELFWNLKQDDENLNQWVITQTFRLQEKIDSKL